MALTAEEKLKKLLIIKPTGKLLPPSELADKQKLAIWLSQRLNEVKSEIDSHKHVEAVTEYNAIVSECLNRLASVKNTKVILSPAHTHSHNDHGSKISLSSFVSRYLAGKIDRPEHGWHIRDLEGRIVLTGFLLKPAQGFYNDGFISARFDWIWLLPILEANRDNDVRYTHIHSARIGLKLSKTGYVAVQAGGYSFEVRPEEFAQDLYNGNVLKKHKSTMSNPKGWSLWTVNEDDMEDEMLCNFEDGRMTFIAEGFEWLV